MMRKVYNKPLILEKMENNEDIELVSLAHFRGRTFENSVVIIDEFQNLTKQPLDRQYLRGMLILRDRK